MGHPRSRHAVVVVLLLLLFRQVRIADVLGFAQSPDSAEAALWVANANRLPEGIVILLSR